MHKKYRNNLQEMHIEWIRDAWEFHKKCKGNAYEMQLKCTWNAKGISRIAKECRRNTMESHQERKREANKYTVKCKKQTTKWINFARKILFFSSMIQLQSNNPLTLTNLWNSESFDCIYNPCLIKYLFVSVDIVGGVSS